MAGGGRYFFGVAALGRSKLATEPCNRSRFFFPSCHRSMNPAYFADSPTWSSKQEPTTWTCSTSVNRSPEAGGRSSARLAAGTSRSAARSPAVARAAIPSSLLPLRQACQRLTRGSDLGADLVSRHPDGVPHVPTDGDSGLSWLDLRMSRVGGRSWARFGRYSSRVISCIRLMTLWMRTAALRALLTHSCSGVW